MTTSTQIALIALIVLLVATFIFFTYKPVPTANNNPETNRINEALNKMRRLFTERSYLTRMSNIEDMTGYNGAKVTAEKFMGNSDQLGRNFGNLYGSDKGNEFGNLMRNNHNGIVNVIKSSKQRKNVDQEYQELEKTNDQIVDFLTNTNQCLDPQLLKSFLNCQLAAFRKSVEHTLNDETIGSMASFDTYNKSAQDFIDYLEKQCWKDLTGNQTLRNPI